MKKIHLYVIKSFLGPFVFTFFIALFIILLQFLWLHIDDMVGKGLEIHIIGKLMFFASSTFAFVDVLPNGNPMTVAILISVPERSFLA